MAVKSLYEPFRSHSSSMYRCECGCGSLKLAGYDVAGNVRCEIAHQPEQWLEIMKKMIRECQAMIDAPPESS